MNWGVEEKHGHMPLARGQGFEIIILCDPSHYKVNIILEATWKGKVPKYG